ncbi:MAG: hypothetical protein WCG75_08365 [Armatimonadota bacterium]
MHRAVDLHQYCVKAAEELAGSDGFVPLRGLSERFKTPVVFRPLLVEAMLASITETESSRALAPTAWRVLVDSERFPITQQQFNSETSISPLPERVRNTVAHEILHSLSFRQTESGVDFRMAPKKGEEDAAFLARVERETEKLSPLLLIPQKVLNKVANNTNFGIEDISAIHSACSVSRGVLVNRLRLLADYDPNNLRYHSSLVNTAVGIGEWIDQKSAQFLEWPLFANFDKNRNPPFISELLRGHSVLSTTVIQDPSFILNGGTQGCCEFDGHHEGERLAYLRMRVRLTVEDCCKKRAGRFLFLLKKI